MRQFVKACISKTDNNFIKKKTDNNVFLKQKKKMIIMQASLKPFHLRKMFQGLSIEYSKVVLLHQ